MAQPAYSRMQSASFPENDRNVHPKKTNRSTLVATVFRPLKLQLFTQCFAWNKPNESRKVALYHDRGIAVFFWLIHLPAFAGALTLIVLNFTRFYVGRTSTSAAQLQFVAKLHELLMQTSIGTMILHYIRSLACNHSLPFGALLAPLHLAHFSFLWSLELWSALTSVTFPKYRKLVFATVLPTAILLGAVMGPSSAIAMIPRPVTSPPLNGWTAHIYKSFEDLFPQVVDKSLPIGAPLSISGVITKPFNGLKDIAILSPKTTSRATNEIRLLKAMYDTWQCDAKTGTVLSKAIATIPSQLGSALLDDNSVRSDGDIFLAKFRQPVVMAICETSSSWYNHDIDQLDLESLRESLLEVDRSCRDNLADNLSADKLLTLVNSSMTTKDIAGVWRKAPGAIRPLVHIYMRGLQTHICTVQAFWMPVTYRREYLFGSAITKTMPPFTENMLRQAISDRNRLLDINLQPSFLDNTSNTGAGPGYFAGLHDTMELNLASLVVQRLSNLDHHNGNGDYGTWQSWNNGVWYFNNSCSTCTNITVTQHEIGYSYGAWNTSLILSISVLSIYCLLVLGYVSFSLVSGTSSTAWDSAASLITLALQSQKPDHLGHTGVDIHTMATFREPVKIRVNERDRVELVFVHSKDGKSRDWRKVEANKEY